MVVVSAVVGVLVSGCGHAGPPQVTFFANGTAVATGPSEYCDTEVEHCVADPKAGVTLQVRPGQPVQISVPSEVGSAVWQVVFKYRNRAGAEIDDRSRVFPANDRLAYTLVLPEAGDQLTTAEVQRFSTVVTQQADGELGFPISASWVLSTTS